MSDSQLRRPDLAPELTGAELLRWYWLKSELISFARRLEVAASGSKNELTTRLAAVLDGQVPPSTRTAGRRGDQLLADLSSSTIIPAGQRCSRELRGWFGAVIGPSFRFDRHMRDFIKSANGTTTLADAVVHWESTRNDKETVIDPQFEFNRFTRAWHETNPTGTRAELLADWGRYRDRPVDERGRA